MIPNASPTVSGLPAAGGVGGGGSGGGRLLLTLAGLIVAAGGGCFVWGSQRWRRGRM
ncbi:MAG: hypothetical protein Q8Q00_03615 [Dehalococcoidia bacterium]|nr:hypothetical protein [Dehalococcoidia bacterium]